MATPAGIQVEEEKKDPNSGVTQETMSEASPSTGSALGIGSTSKAAPDNVVVKPVTQVDKTVAEPIKPIQQVFTSPTPPPPEDEEAKAAAAARAQGLAMKKKADEASNKFTRSAIDRGVGTAGQGVTTTVEAPPETGIDFAEVKKLQEEQKKKMVNDLLAKEAIDMKNVQNTFSHLFSRGQDSGRMNAANLSAFRDAGRRFDDAKMNLDNRFMNSQIRLTELEATEDARIREAQRNKWETGMKDQIDMLIENDLFDEANALANEIAEVSDNKYFSSYSNPNVIEALKQKGDVESSALWVDSFNRGNDSFISHADSPEFLKEQAIDLAFESMLSASPERTTVMVGSYFDNFDEEGFDDLDIDADDQKIIEDFESGIRDIHDKEVQKVYGKTQMADLKASNKKVNERAAIDAEGISQSVIDSPIGEEILDWITSPNAEVLKIDVDPAFGGINEVSFYGQEVGANQLAGLPGVDVYTEDFNGQAIMGEVTMQDVMDDIVSVNGVDYKQGDLYDAYNKYHKEQSKEFLQSTSEERDNFGIPLDKDQFLGQLTKLTRDANGKVSMEDLVNDIKGVREAGEGTTITASEYTDPTTGNVETLPERLSEALPEDKQAQLISILEGASNIHDLEDNPMKDLLAESITGDEKYDTELVELLRSKGLMVTMDAPTQLQRETLVQDKGHPFSEDKLEDTLSKLKVEDGAAKGYIEMDGEIWEVSGQPGRHHTATDGTWLPIIEWNLTPMFDTKNESIPYKTQVPWGDVAVQGKGQAALSAEAFLENYKTPRQSKADNVSHGRQKETLKKSLGRRGK